MATLSISASAKPKAGASTLVLTQREIMRLVDMRTAIRVTERAFKAQALGQASMPPKLYLDVPEGDFRAMPAYIAKPPAAGLKWVNVHPKNPAKGLPTVMATILLNDPATGAPLAIMDGLHITKLRTAASAAVAARALARKDSRTVGLVGCGAQAIAQLAALERVFKLQKVLVWAYHPGEAQEFCAKAGMRLPGLRLRAVRSVDECASGADILITLTPSRKPLVMRQYVSAGAHVNAIGADAPGKQELDPKILNDALVVVDDRAQAIHAGEINVPVTKKQFDPRDIHATVGEVLTEKKKGRTRPSQITLFDSTGLAIHDIALASEAYRLALKSHVGRVVSF